MQLDDERLTVRLHSGPVGLKWLTFTLCHGVNACHDHWGEDRCNLLQGDIGVLYNVMQPCDRLYFGAAHVDPFHDTLYVCDVRPTCEVGLVTVRCTG